MTDHERLRRSALRPSDKADDAGSDSSEPAEYVPRSGIAVPGLAVGRADHPAEAAADRMAESALSRIRRLTVAGSAATSTGADLSGSMEMFARRQVRRSPTAGGQIGPAGGELDPAAANRLSVLRGAGSPLPEQLRRTMETGFGADLSRVRVHQGAQAAALNRSMSAQAFTVGHDVFFRDGLPDAATPGGQHLLAHELAHVVQEGPGAIHRKLDPDAIVSAVESAPFLKDRLDKQSLAQKRNAKENQTIRDRVVLILEQSQEMFGKDDGMGIALTIDQIAKALAEDSFDSSLKTPIAEHLMKKFRSQISATMPKKGRRAGLNRAKALLSTDAVSLYMHGERDLKDAAWDIKEAADKAKIKDPVSLFEDLKQKFQAELASYTLERVRDEQDKSTGFNQSEITGALSTNYMKELFGPGLAGDQLMPKNKAGDGLEFAKDSGDRLEKLAAKVAETAQPGAKDPRPKNKDERRARYLQDVSDRDADIAPTREQQVVDKLKLAPWSLTENQAKQVVTKLKAGLLAMPLTVTHGTGRLPSDVSKEIDAVDQSRAGRLEEVDIAGKKFNTPGAWKGTGTSARGGEGYTRFRGWKDRMMTGNLGFSGDEMPTYGALNPHFEVNAGTGEGIDDQYEVTSELNKKRKNAAAPMAAPAQLSKGQAAKNWFGRNVALGKTRQSAKDDHTNRKKYEADYNAEQKQIDVDNAKGAEARKYRTKDFGRNYYGDIHLVLKRSTVGDRIVYTASDHGQPHRDPFLTFADFLLGSQGDYHADLTKLKRPDAGGFKDKSALAKPLARSTEIVQPEYAASIIAVVLGSKKAASWTLPFEVQIHGGVDWAKDVTEIVVAPTLDAKALKQLQDWSNASPGRPTVVVAASPDETKISTVKDMVTSGTKRAAKL